MSSSKSTEPVVRTDAEEELRRIKLVNRWSSLRAKAARLRKEALEAEQEAAELKNRHPFLGHVLGEIRRGLKKKPEAPSDKMETDEPAEGKGKRKAAEEEPKLKGRAFLEKKIRREAQVVAKSEQAELSQKLKAEKAGKFTELE